MDGDESLHQAFHQHISSCDKCRQDYELENQMDGILCNTFNKQKESIKQTSQFPSVQFHLNLLHALQDCKQDNIEIYSQHHSSEETVVNGNETISVYRETYSQTAFVSNIQGKSSLKSMRNRLNNWLNSFTGKAHTPNVGFSSRLLGPTMATAALVFCTVALTSDWWQGEHKEEIVAMKSSLPPASPYPASSDLDTNLNQNLTPKTDKKFNKAYLLNGGTAYSKAGAVSQYKGAQVASAGETNSDAKDPFNDETPFMHVGSIYDNTNMPKTTSDIEASDESNDTELASNIDESKVSDTEDGEEPSKVILPQTEVFQNFLVPVASSPSSQKPQTSNQP